MFTLLTTSKLTQHYHMILQASKTDVFPCSEVLENACNAAQILGSASAGIIPQPQHATLLQPPLEPSDSQMDGTLLVDDEIGTMSQYMDELTWYHRIKSIDFVEPVGLRRRIYFTL